VIIPNKNKSLLVSKLSKNVYGNKIFLLYHENTTTKQRCNSLW